MSDAEFIDDRGEAGPEDNAEWLRWAAETYARAVAKGGCYAPEPDWDVDSISPGLLKAAAEIDRLRARVEELERIRAAAWDLCGYECSWYWGEKLKALRAALKGAKP